MRIKWLFLLCAVLFGITLPLVAQETPDASDLPQTREDAAGIAQVYVPAGCFMMGSSAEQLEAVRAENPPDWVERELQHEEPQRETCVSTGFWLDQYEVTNAAYMGFVEDRGYTRPELWSERGQAWLARQRRPENYPLKCIADATPEQPRVCVTWYEADAYARWRGGRLPSEAEWEYAARGPDSLIYPWGDEWNADYTHLEGATHPADVRTYPEDVSWVGAYDMGGNAMEWVNDWFDSQYYATAPRDDPQGAEEATAKIEKGGWWGSNRWVARSAARYYEDPPLYQDHHIGFRVVLDE